MSPAILHSHVKRTFEYYNIAVQNSKGGVMMNACRNLYLYLMVFIGDFDRVVGVVYGSQESLNYLQFTL